jgi:exopolysaccharide production protein ExoZ
MRPYNPGGKATFCATHKPCPFVRRQGDESTQLTVGVDIVQHSQALLTTPVLEATDRGVHNVAEKQDRKDNQLVAVQYLRAIAALMVVVHHARNSAPWLFNPLENYPAFAWGVDIFFVISGFIMYVSARNEAPLEFLRRRAIRVVPLYWLATLGLFLLGSHRHLTDVSRPELEHILKSLFFVPHYSYSQPGEMFPYLVPGWTLNFEVFFYLVFFFSLFQKKVLLIGTAVMGVLVGVGLFVHTDNPLVLTYTRPVLLEFIVGVWIGKLYVEDRVARAGAWLLPLGFTALLALPLVTSQVLQTYGRIVSSSLMLLGGVSATAVMPRVKLLKQLGDASYSIYLSHTILSMSISDKLMRRVPLGGWVQFSVWVLLSLVVSSVVGYLVYAVVERPMLNWMRGRRSAEAQRRPG